ncbi:hypothetical protein [Microscilla marina]|uniref:Outer membrane protein beta-barrel domain-containing protein n=1 Tax=Microscilla marina ATCC 23134 TaxID=313606 RepID=A1ZTS8_MICM2|nr:hypothetical protein [Microscilla marina]EAY26180.1 hypothetical protein M23134_02512 [Microscilla marina ATCC 23134]
MNNKVFKSVVSGFILCLIYQTSFAQFGFNMGYTYSKPMEEMASTIRKMHGFNLELIYKIPKSPFSVGLDLGLSGYGNRKLDNFTVVQDEQIQGTYDLTINNYVCDAFITGRVDLLSKGIIRPYISARIGVQEYHTDYILENPNIQHTTECPDPVEEGTVLRDVAMAAGFGFGVRIDMGQIFKLGMGNNRLFLNIESTYLSGGTVRYMSLNAPANVVPSNTDMPGLAPGVSTITHPYHTGKVYQSKISMTNLRIGMGVHF